MRKLNRSPGYVLTKKACYVRYLQRLLILGKIEMDDYSRELGRYFGYPKCCVENFIFINSQGYGTGAVMDEFFEKDFPSSKGEFFCCGYVQCPICRVSSFFTKALKKLPAPHPANRNVFFPEGRVGVDSEIIGEE